jgi:protein-disulfide isomerase
VIATFVDFQCPYCKALAPVLDSILNEFDGQVALEVHHFPLPSHERALPMAIASECADRQGRFKEMYTTLYVQADSIGKKPWAAIASDARIADIPAFEACAKLPAGTFKRIDSGLTLGRRIGVRGTPTVYINGTYTLDRTVAEFRSSAKELGASPR